MSTLPGNCNISGDKFTGMLNRALDRLYNNSAQHGNLRELDVTPANNLVDLDICSYAHALAFKVGEGDCLKQYRIVPLVETWKRDKAGWDAFVDMGISDTDNTIRQFRLPENFHDKDVSNYTFKMLAKKAYTPLVNDSDIANVRSLGAIKNAIIAIMHEDNTDPDTALKYWQIALREVEKADKTFRGPVVPTVSFHEEGLTDVTRGLI